jgi:hypothetical protein
MVRQIPCSGDILANLQTLCSIDGLYVSNMVPRDLRHSSTTCRFTVNEVNASTVLLKYAPGDVITGESFTGAAGRTYIDSQLVIRTAGLNVKRDSHFPFLNAARSLLLEGGRTNNITFSEQIDNAAWTRLGTTVTPNATAAPDGNVTADKVVEDATAGAHYVLRSGLTTTASTDQPVMIFAAAAERSWIRITSVDRAGTVRDSWVNIATGAVGTKKRGHTIRTTLLVNSFYRIECVFNSGVGAGSVDWYTCLATGDGVSTYAGTAGSGAYLWGGQHEADGLFSTSYIPTTNAAVARGADSYSLPFAWPPGELSLYSKFIEGGTIKTANGGVAEIANAADGNPRLILYHQRLLYRVPRQRCGERHH